MTVSAPRNDGPSLIHAGNAGGPGARLIPPGRRGSISSPSGATIAPPLGPRGRGRGGSIAYQPLKSTGHNSTPSVQLDPAAFAAMLAAQANASAAAAAGSGVAQGPWAHRSHVASGVVTGVVPQRTGAATSAVTTKPVKRVVVNIPTEPRGNGHSDSRAAEMYTRLPEMLKEEGLRLEEEIGEELDASLNLSVSSSASESDDGSGSSRAASGSDTSGSSTSDTASVNSATAGSTSGVFTTQPAINVDGRDVKMARLLVLRALDHRLSIWPIRRPEQVNLSLPSVSSTTQESSSPLKQQLRAMDLGWLDRDLDAISRLQHDEEVTPSPLPETLAIAIPPPPYRSWSAYLNWRNQELQRIWALQQAAWSREHAVDVRFHTCDDGVNGNCTDTFLACRIPSRRLLLPQATWL